MQAVLASGDSHHPFHRWLNQSYPIPHANKLHPPEARADFDKGKGERPHPNARDRFQMRDVTLGQHGQPVGGEMDGGGAVDGR